MAKNKNFEKALSFTLKWEGGYANDPADYGGKTMMGITQQTLDQAYKYRIVTHNVVRRLTRFEVAQIYNRMYWLVCRADEMPDPLCVIHFDTCVLRGSVGAGKTLQFTLNGLYKVGLKVDGKIGPLTLRALKWYWADGARAICTRYLAQRESFHKLRVRDDHTQGRFLNGWMNRVDDLRKYTEGVLGNG